MLYERIREISKKYCGSNSRLASLLNIKQSTFSQYFNEKRQDNLWPLLPQILELFPEVNREWLYHGEGEITKGVDPAFMKLQLENEILLHQLDQAKKELSEADQSIKNKEDELNEERRLNKKLINRLLLEGSPQHGSEVGHTDEAAV